MMKNKMKVFILDTETQSRNGYIVHSVEHAFRSNKKVAEVKIGSFNNALDFIADYDVFLAIGSLNQHAPLINRLARRASVSVLWTTEDPYEHETNARFSTSFDIVYSNEKNSVSMYNQSVNHLPLAASQLYHDYSVLDDDKEYYYDILFVGTAWPNRVHTINRLLRNFGNKIKVKVALPYNQHIPVPRIERSDVFWNWRCSAVDFGKFANKSRVVLTLPRVYTNDALSVAAGVTPPPRLFETSLAGGFQVVCAPGLDVGSYYSQNDMLAMCENEHEIIEQIDRALSNSNDRIEMAKLAREHTAAKHTYINRVKSIVDACDRQLRRASKSSVLADNKIQNRKHVLFLTHNTIKFGNWGGVEVYQDFISSRLTTFKFSFAFIRYTEGEYFLVVQSIEKDYKYKIPGYNPERLLTDAFLEQIIQKIIFEHRIDLVHFQHFIGFPISILAIPKACGVPSVYTMHDYFLISERFTLMNDNGMHVDVHEFTASQFEADLPTGSYGGHTRRSNYVRSMVESLESIICNTAYSQKLLESVYGSNSLPAIEIVEMLAPSFEDNERRNNKPRSTEWGNPLRVLVPGNFTKEKGAIEIFNVIKSAVGMGIEFYIAGRIDGHSELAAQLQYFPNVKVIGPYSYSDAIDTFMDYDVSLHCSIWPETYMISLSEAWAAGLIPIGTRLGAQGERIVDGFNGLLVEPNSSSEIFTALIRIQCDKILAAAIKRNVASMNLSSSADHLNKMANIYKNLIDRYKPHHEKFPAMFAGRYNISAEALGYRPSASRWIDDSVVWDQVPEFQIGYRADGSATSFEPVDLTTFSHLPTENVSRSNSNFHLKTGLGVTCGSNYGGSVLFFRDSVDISGWMIDVGRPFLVFRYMIISNRFFSAMINCTLSEPTDSDQLAGDENFVRSGFDVRASSEEIPDGSYDLSIVSVYDGLVVKTEFLAKIVIVHHSQFEGSEFYNAASGSTISIVAPAEGFRCASKSLDVSPLTMAAGEPRGFEISVASFSGSGLAAQRAELALYSLSGGGLMKIPLQTSDVGVNKVKDFGYGFYCLIEASLLMKGAYKICFVEKSGNYDKCILTDLILIIGSESRLGGDFVEIGMEQMLKGLRIEECGSSEISRFHVDTISGGQKALVETPFELSGWMNAAGNGKIIGALMAVSDSFGCSVTRLNTVVRKDVIDYFSEFTDQNCGFHYSCSEIDWDEVYVFQFYSSGMVLKLKLDVQGNDLTIQ
ncbi:glycosyltransferase [Nostoc sp. CHAB 5834]|nr:glycosyltransferase [Nostoc sp. CHAB 5834]